MHRSAQHMAFGGMMTAVAVVIMCLGSLIPINTYVCPVLCILLQNLVFRQCGRRYGWSCYLAIAILSLLLAPDREAALVYLCLGDYPMLRSLFERLRPMLLRTVVKLVFFTVAGILAYGLLAMVIGLDAVLAEFDGAVWLLVVTVLLWDVLFLLVDRLLGMEFRRKR